MDTSNLGDQSMNDEDFFAMASRGPRDGSSSTTIKRDSAAARMSARNSKHLASRMAGNMLRENQITLGGGGGGGFAFGNFGEEELD